MHPAKISIGNNNFREIRENNFYYVDKTLFLEELLSDAPQRTLLITRPRRFGKTMMMSTLFEFFDINKNSNDLFNGLSISKNFDICNKWMNKYPTVYITLRDLDCDSFSIFLDRFALYIRQFLNEHKYLLDSPRVSKIHKEDILNLIGDKYNIRKLEHLLVTICSALYEHYEKEVIVLIDEYDSPLNFSYKNNYYKECVDFIKTFFYPLKDCAPIKFSILTGCLRIAKESIFTGMNHFVCCDISNNTYADKFGFTDNEIDKILNDTGFSEKKYKIKEWYDGYCFGNIDGIYCPWDIMQYIYALQKDPTAEPELFWKNTSGNDIIQLAIQKIENTSREKIEILLSDKSIQEKLETQLTYDSITESESTIWSLLYASGYLTRTDPKHYRKFTTIKIPNKEVKEIFATDVQRWFEQSMQNKNLSSFADDFWCGNSQHLKNELTNILYETISYFDYDEKYYHGFIIGILKGAGLHAISNTEEGLERPDIVIKDHIKKQCVIIEIKRTRSENKLDAVAEKALHQIKVKKYVKGLPKTFTSVLVYGIAFWKKECAVKMLRSR